jgi:phosphinothricin acetyltransferase
MKFIIDSMKPEDWPQISEIYQEGIATGVATFASQVPTWEEWDSDHTEICRLVARHGDSILGWTALSLTSRRHSYAGVAELSIYVASKSKGLGVGTALLTALIEASEQAGFWTLWAGILSGNAASRGLHKKCGFREVGVRERLGRMDDGTWHDVVLMERRSGRF